MLIPCVSLTNSPHCAPRRKKRCRLSTRSSSRASRASARRMCRSVAGFNRAWFDCARRMTRRIRYRICCWESAVRKACCSNAARCCKSLCSLFSSLLCRAHGKAPSSRKPVESRSVRGISLLALSLIAFSITLQACLSSSWIQSNTLVCRIAAVSERSTPSVCLLD